MNTAARRVSAATLLEKIHLRRLSSTSPFREPLIPLLRTAMNGDQTGFGQPGHSDWTLVKRDFTIKHILDLADDQHTEDKLSSKKFQQKLQQCKKTHKRVRTIFTSEQLQKLEACFQVQQYMVRNERIALADSLALAEPQVKIWFQNRRIKWRKVQHELNLSRMNKMDDNDEHQCENSSGMSQQYSSNLF